jgi:bacteriorhodopsin
MRATASAPRWLGIVLTVAGAMYIVDTLANALLSNYADLANLFLVLVAVPSVVGELWFTIWLLTRAGKEEVPAA